MPAMTGVALAAAGPGRAGLGAAVLNSARPAGRALGVAVLGSATLQRLALREPPGNPWLTLPMTVAAIGYLAACILTLSTVGRPDGSAGP